MVINRPLSASSIYYDPWHPPCSPLSNTCVPWPTPLTTLNDTQIHSAVLPQYTFWTDRPTERPTDRWSRQETRKNSAYARERQTNNNTHLMALCLGLPGWTGTRKPIWIYWSKQQWVVVWYQLGHMQICTSPQTDNRASTPPLSFLLAGCPSCHPANSVRHWRQFLMMVHGTFFNCVHQLYCYCAQCCRI